MRTCGIIDEDELCYKYAFKQKEMELIQECIGCIWKQTRIGNLRWREYWHTDISNDTDGVR